MSSSPLHFCPSYFCFNNLILFSSRERGGRDLRANLLLLQVSLTQLLCGECLPTLKRNPPSKLLACLCFCVHVGSPYLSSMNVNPRRVAVAAWRLPRASLGDTRGDTPGDTGSARLTSLSNGHGRYCTNTTVAPQPLSP